jgi:hypothetical protein
MQPHRIGQQLRAVVLRDHQEGRPLDPRRLQAVIGDLCADAQADLVGPLRYLVLSGAFASAAGMDPPLADGRHLPRLQHELAEMYAPALCARLLPLLEGLLELPDSSLHRTAAMATQAPPAEPAERNIATAPARAGSAGASLLILLLAFLSGVLMVALLGVALLLWQRHRGSLPGGTVPGPSAMATGTPGGTAAPAPSPVSPPPEPSAAPVAEQPPPPPAAPTEASAPLDRAVASIQELYGALSAKDFSRAQPLFGPAAADQFDPSFFRQFERVSVGNLRSTGEEGSTLNLEGVVTFVWPDGSLQTETRTFSVDTSTSPAVITGSAFGAVLTPRR